MKRICLVLLGLMVVCGCVSAQKQQVQKLMALDKAHFKRTLTIKNDPLEPTVKFSTVNGFIERQGLLNIPAARDHFIRAIVNKKTGEAVFQIYNIVQYGGDWRFYNRVAYLDDFGEPVVKEARSLSRDVVGCRSGITGGCTFREHIAFDIDEALVDIISYKKEPWMFKLKSKAGVDYKDGIMPAEVAGLYEGVQEYRESHGLN